MEVPGSNAPPKTMWFDRETGLLHEETVEETVDGEVQSQLLVYGDYRDVDGVQVPFSIKVTTAVGEASQVLDILTQRVEHKAVKAETFAVPVLPDPDPKPDTLLASLAAARKAAKDDPAEITAQTEHMRLAYAAAYFEEATKAPTSCSASTPKSPRRCSSRHGCS